MDSVESRKDNRLVTWLLVTWVLACARGSPRERFILETSNAVYDNHNVHDGHRTFITTHVDIITNHNGCLFRGAHYRLVQSIPDADGCSVWTCATQGMIKYDARCLFRPSSQNDTYKCNYGGVTYDFGVAFLYADGCNQCVCSYTIECTSLAHCGATPTQAPYPCTHDGQIYHVGQTVETTPDCTVCTCTSSGFQCAWKQCTSRPTSPPTTSTPTLQPTTNTPTPATTSAVHPVACYHPNGMPIPIGVGYRKDDGCTVCTCMYGGVECEALASCQQHHATAKPVPTCLDNGHIYNEGDVIEQDNICYKCTCHDGKVMCPNICG